MNAYCYHKNERPPEKADTDVQGCVMVFDELAGAWTVRHYLNLDGNHLNWWMHMPQRPAALRKRE